MSTKTAADDALVSPAELPELGSGTGPGELAELALLGEVNLEVSVELGRVTMRLRDILALREGTVVELDRTAGAPVDVLVNGTLVARGDVVVVDDELGVRITQVVEPH